jgi:hypothetical protein
MEREFVPYELALELKHLGFDEECIASYFFPNDKELKFPSSWRRNSTLYLGEDACTAPLYQQAFRWFRENYALCIVIKPIDDKNLELGYNLLKNGLMMGSYLNYEEAELACLQKLIEIVKTK